VTRRSVAFTLLLAVLAVLTTAGPATAHETAATGVVRLAQSLGDRDLTVTLVPPSTGSGRMSVALEALGTGGGAPVRVSAEPVGAAGGTAASTAIVPGRVGAPGQSGVTLDQPGRWEVVLDDGASRARIPMTYVDPGTPGWVRVVRTGAVLALVAGIVATTRTARRRPWFLGIAAGLAVAGAAVAATAYAYGVTPAAAGYVVGGAVNAAAPGATPTTSPGMAGMGGMAGMAGGQAMSGTAEGAVVMTAGLTGAPGPTGAGSVLDLRLTDGSTGAPVDDLEVHDEAFIHLAVLGADGSEQHLHPVRTAPGDWQVRFAPAGGGRYGLFAEFAREDGGHVLVRSAVDVPGPAAAPAVPPGPGPRTLPGAVEATVSVEGAVAGSPTRVRMSLSSGGRPVTDLQYWLGMAGHLFVLGPGAGGTPDPMDVSATFAHVHDMQVAPPGHGLGPEISFDYTFPTAGTYRLWLQALRAGSVITVPVDVVVAPPAPAA
jgi:hypothetical protein